MRLPPPVPSPVTVTAAFSWTRIRVPQIRQWESIAHGRSEVRLYELLRLDVFTILDGECSGETWRLLARAKAEWVWQLIMIGDDEEFSRIVSDEAERRYVDRQLDKFGLRRNMQIQLELLDLLRTEASVEVEPWDAHARRLEEVRRLLYRLEAEMAGLEGRPSSSLCAPEGERKKDKAARLKVYARGAAQFAANPLLQELKPPDEP